MSPQDDPLKTNKQKHFYTSRRNLDNVEQLTHLFERCTLESASTKHN